MNAKSERVHKWIVATGALLAGIGTIPIAISQTSTNIQLSDTALTIFAWIALIGGFVTPLVAVWWRVVSSNGHDQPML